MISPLLAETILKYLKNPIELVYLVVDFLLEHKRFLILIAVTFFGILGISVLFRGGIGPPPRRTDLTVFLRAAEAIQSGEHIYLVTNARGWSYMYLPLLAIMLTPFTSLPLLVNTSWWYLLSVASFFGMIFLSTRLIQNHRLGMRAAVMASLFCIPPLLEAATRGQPDIMVTFLAVAILYLYMQKKDVWAGLLFAFTVAFKFSPLAPLIVLFLVKRDWKVCASFFIGIILFVVVLPSLFIGTEQNWFFVTEWNRIMSHAVSEAGHESHLWAQVVTPFAEDNQSLYATITRWVWPSESVLVANSNSFLRWGVRAFSFLLLGLLAFLSRKKREEVSREKLLLEYSLYTVLIFFASPVASLHHYIILYLMYLASFFYLEKVPRGSFSYQILSWGALIAFITYLLGLAARDPFCYWGFPVLGVLIFWCVLVVFLGRKDREELKI